MVMEINWCVSTLMIVLYVWEALPVAGISSFSARMVSCFHSNPLVETFREMSLIDRLFRTASGWPRDDLLDLRSIDSRQAPLYPFDKPSRTQVSRTALHQSDVSSSLTRGCVGDDRVFHCPVLIGSSFGLKPGVGNPWSCGDVPHSP